MPKRLKVPTHAPTVGQFVNYHSRIGGPITMNARVTSEVRLLGGHTWVLDIEGHRGCVALAACSAVLSDPWLSFTPGGEHTVSIPIMVQASSPQDAVAKVLTSMRTPGQLGYLLFHVTDPAGRSFRIGEVDLVKPGAQARVVSSDEITNSPGLRLDAGHYLGKP